MFANIYTFGVAFLTQQQHMGPFNDRTRTFRGKLVHTEQIVGQLVRTTLHLTCLPLPSSVSAADARAASHSVSLESYAQCLIEAMQFPL